MGRSPWGSSTIHHAGGPKDRLSANTTNPEGRIAHSVIRCALSLAGRPTGRPADPDSANEGSNPPPRNILPLSRGTMNGAFHPQKTGKFMQMNKSQETDHIYRDLHKKVTL